jgi:hypothetical protein
MPNTVFLNEIHGLILSPMRSLYSNVENTAASSQEVSCKGAMQYWQPASEKALTMSTCPVSHAESTTSLGILDFAFVLPEAD